MVLVIIYFSLAPPIGQSFHLFSKVFLNTLWSYNIIYWLEGHNIFYCEIHGSQINPVDLRNNLAYQHKVVVNVQ